MSVTIGVRARVACIRIALACGILLVATRPAAAQAQAQVRVVKDQSIVWNVTMPTPITTLKAGTLLEVIGRDGEFYVVRLPQSSGRVAGTGRIAISQVELVGGTPPPEQVPPRARDVFDEPPPSEASSAPRRAVGAYGFVDGGLSTWLAHHTFSAVMGSRGAPIYGGGGQVQLRERVIIEAGVERIRQTGERVFVSNGEVFKLGIRDTVQITPVYVTAAYRERAGRIAYYAGGGAGRYFYKEESEFALPEENIDQAFTSYHIVGGAEFGLTSLLRTAFEVRFTSVPNALGTSGASAAFAEHNLGGVQFRVKILVGR